MPYTYFDGPSRSCHGIAKAGPLAAEQLEEHGRAAVLLGFEYFAKLFVAADGKMWGLKMAYYAATAFDALKLCDMTVASASVRIDRLVCTKSCTSTSPSSRPPSSPTSRLSCPKCWRSPPCLLSRH